MDGLGFFWVKEEKKENKKDRTEKQLDVRFFPCYRGDETGGKRKLKITEYVVVDNPIPDP